MRPTTIWVMSEFGPENKPHTSRAIDALASIALNYFHIPFDEKTMVRLRDAMFVMRSTDNVVDESSNPADLQRLLLILETFDVSYPSLSAEELGGQRYSDLVKLAAGIIRHGEEMKHASAEAYPAARRNEAIKTAAVITSLPTDEVKSHHLYGDFTALIEHLAIAAGYINTAKDAVQDYEDGILSFEPSKAFRRKLLTMGLRELSVATPVFTNPKVAASFGRLGIRAFLSHRAKKRNRNSPST